MDDDRQEADDSERLNRLIGWRYRLDAPIGRGGMGTVWSGTDELLNRPVAVKELVLPPSIPEYEAAKLRERALREARAMASLNHPNTVQLYDVVHEHDQQFMVMELVRGVSLSTLINEGRRLTDQQLAVIIDSTAAALEAAHRAGIVHRDVKPGNVLIGPDQIKLADFGLVRNAAEATMTSSKQILGTPAYIAPEMVLRGDTSPAVDLWGLGATAFAAAEGRPPYDSTTDPLITVSSIVDGPVPQHHQHGPIGEVISGLMVKEPEQRMPLAEVRSRLHHLLPAAGPTPFETTLAATPPTSPSVAATPQTTGLYSTEPAAAENAAKLTIPPSAAAVQNQVAQVSSRPSPFLPANAFQAATPYPAEEKVPGPRKLVFIATAILAVAALVVAAVMYLQGSTRTGGDLTAQQQTQQPTTSAQIPHSFVPLPVRPTPLPDPVHCQYYPANTEPTAKPPANRSVSSKGTVQATINTTAGAIPLLLDRSLAPCTVNSFVSLIRQGYFTDTSCHRLTTGALQMLQCGDPTGASLGGPGYAFNDETFPDLKYGRGTLAMANAGPNTNGSQFFMVYGNAPLDPDYTVFGSISDTGLQVLDKIARAGDDGSLDSSAGGGKPNMEVKITGVSIDS